MKPLSSLEDIVKADGEMMDIFKNIEAIKGKVYCEGLRIIFALINYRTTITPVMHQAITEPSELVAALNLLNVSYDNNIKNLIIFVIKQTIVVTEDSAEFKDIMNKKVMEFAQDILMLDNKQEEYGAIAFPYPKE